MRARYVLPNFRIAVVGAGAIGGYYGAKLAYFGRDVHFLMRGDLREVRRFGIRVRGKTENFRLAKVHCYNSTEEIGPCDLVLIALKTTANEQLRTLIPPLLKEGTMLLTLQNGLGNEEFLAQHFGAERVMGALCFVCLIRTAPGVIEQYGTGRIVLGEYLRYPLPRTHDVSWEFKRCGVVCSVAENLRRERWRKLVWNIPFNGLSVVAGGLDTAAILADEKLRARVLALDGRSDRGRQPLRLRFADRRSARANQAHGKDGRLQAFHPDRLRGGQAARTGGDLGRTVAAGARGGRGDAALERALRAAAGSQRRGRRSDHDVASADSSAECAT